jgi:hypothetical protein
MAGAILSKAIAGEPVSIPLRTIDTACFNAVRS